MSDHAITLEHVSFESGGRVIFSDINLTIKPGSITAIMGPSGTGKTTLLRLIGGLLTPTQGDIKIFDKNIVQANRRLKRHIRQHMGLLFQQGALFSDLSVYENVAFQLREHTHFPESMVRDLVMMKLEAVGLRGAAHLSVGELSGGMARRVALARAVMLDPSVMLYDEPFTGQDPINKAVLLKLICTLNTVLNMTSVVVSHDIQETLEIADEVFILEGGRILASGKPELVLQTPNDAVRQFLTGEADGPVAFHYPAQTMRKDLEVDA